MTPDLEVVVEVPDLTAERAQAIVGGSWPSNALGVSVCGTGSWIRRLSRRPPKSITFCIEAHDFLSDDADWNAPTWAFEPDSLPRFLATFRHLFDVLDRQVSVIAMWMGDSVQQEVAVSTAEFLALMTSNALGNRVRYLIKASRTDRPGA